LKQVVGIIIGVAIGVALIGGVVSAHQGDAPPQPNSVHACVGKFTGNVRIVGENGKCLPNLETVMHWPSGSGVVLGFYQRNAFFTLGAGIVLCDPGDIVVGGGHQFVVGQSAVLLGSRPGTDGSGTVQGWGVSSQGSEDFDVFAVCADVTP
jgi:hypothetical protein